MHIKNEDQGTGRVALLCIDRSKQHCEIVASTPEEAQPLVNIAKGLGAVPAVYVLVKESEVDEWLSNGWNLTGLKVVAKHLS